MRERESPAAGADGAVRSRALVPTAPSQVNRAPSDSLRGSSDNRPSAAFVTQLIAGEMGLAVSRQRRRAAPEVVVAAYNESAARPQHTRPQRLVRSF
jgi:hypothetical protein